MRDDATHGVLKVGRFDEQVWGDSDERHHRNGHRELLVVGVDLGEWERALLRFAVEHHLAGRYADRVEQQLGCSATR